MIKAEAAKIVARQGKGEKKQKKKESLVGVKYDVNANVRTAKEVAVKLVYPDKKEDNFLSFIRFYTVKYFLVNRSGIPVKSNKIMLKITLNVTP